MGINNNGKVIKEILYILIFFLVSLLSLYGIVIEIYGNLLMQSFHWYEAFIVFLEFISFIIGLMGFIRYLRIINEKGTVQMVDEIRYSEEQNNEYRHQMLLLCDILATRANMLSHDLQQWQQQSNENTWKDQL